MDRCLGGLESMAVKRDDAGFYSVAELRRRLSISSIIFLGFEPVCERSLEKLASAGIKNIELLESPEQFNMADLRSMKAIKEACDATGVRVGAYHCFRTNFDGIESEEERIKRVDKCKRQIETLIEFGGTFWGNHATEQDRNFYTCFTELVRFVEGTNVTIVVENFSRPGLLISDRIGFIDEVDHPQLGFLLDTGHEKDVDRKNPIARPGGAKAIIDKCGHRLKHIHMHGFKQSDHYPPMCEGDRIPWVELTSALYAAGYEGLFNFEPVGEPRNPQKETIEAVGRFPEVISALR